MDSTQALPLPTATRPGYDQQQLAAARTRMANERTLLTYVRTSLALLAFGARRLGTARWWPARRCC